MCAHEIRLNTKITRLFEEYFFNMEMVNYEKVEITEVNTMFLFLHELFSNLVQVTIAFKVLTIC